MDTLKGSELKGVSIAEKKRDGGEEYFINNFDFSNSVFFILVGKYEFLGFHVDRFEAEEVLNRLRANSFESVPVLVNAHEVVYIEKIEFQTY